MNIDLSKIKKQNRRIEKIIKEQKKIISENPEKSAIEALQIARTEVLKSEKND